MALSQNTWMIVETSSRFCQLKITLIIVTKPLSVVFGHLIKHWQHINKKKQEKNKKTPTHTISVICEMIFIK